MVWQVSTYDCISEVIVNVRTKISILGYVDCGKDSGAILFQSAARKHELVSNCMMSFSGMTDSIRMHYMLVQGFRSPDVVDDIIPIG